MATTPYHGGNGRKGRAKLLAQIRLRRTNELAAAGIDARDRQAVHRYEMEQLDLIGRTRKWFVCKGEMERSDAKTDAQRFADELTRSTGKRHKIAWEDAADECGYRVLACER